jgi:hypothetical protein
MTESKPRTLDWVDRLAGVKFLQPRTIVNDWTLTAVGPWIYWPWWRRLLDLIRSRATVATWGVLVTVSYTIRYWSDRHKWGVLPTDDNLYWPHPSVIWDLERALHDIHLGYLSSHTSDLSRRTRKTQWSTVNGPVFRTLRHRRRC